MYTYKVTHFEADVLDKDKDWSGKICGQLEIQLEEYANDGWEFVGQYRFDVDIHETGCFGRATGKNLKTQRLQQLVFRKEV